MVLCKDITLGYDGSFTISNVLDICNENFKISQPQYMRVPSYFSATMYKNSLKTFIDGILYMYVHIV